MSRSTEQRRGLNSLRPAISIVAWALMAVASANSLAQQKEDPDKALADYNQAIRLDPKDARAYIYRGKLKIDMDEFDEALGDYNESIRLNPGLGDAYRNRGAVWVQKAEYDKALADYDQALRLNPRLALVYTKRGDVWNIKEENDRALADYNQAIRLNPKDADAYRGLGCARMAKAEYDKAIANFDETIRLDPKDALAHSLRAWIGATCPNAKYRDANKAVRSATTACQLSEWMDPFHLDNLAAAHAEAGDFGSAVKWQSQAIELLSDEDSKEDYRSRLTLYREKKPYRDTKR